MQGIMNDVKVPPSYTAIKRGLSEPPANDEEVEEEEPESSPLTSLPCSSPPERSPLPVPMYVPRPRNASNSNSLRVSSYNQHSIKAFTDKLHPEPWKGKTSSKRQASGISREQAGSQLADSLQWE